MEKTIEERANRLRQGSNDAYSKGVRRAYIIGAREQREIDIKKACEWLSEHVNDSTPGWEDGCNVEILVEQFRKAMEGE